MPLASITDLPHQRVLAGGGGAGAIPGEPGVDDVHGRIGQQTAAAALLHHDGDGDLRIVIGGKADKNAVVKMKGPNSKYIFLINELLFS